jgi:hypothetical protein
MKTVVLTGSIIARTIGRALSALNPHLRVVAQDAIDEALDHVEAVGEYRVRVREKLAELRKAVDPESANG